MGRHGRGMGDNINIKTVNLAEELQNQDGIPTQEPIRHSGSSVCIWQKHKGTHMHSWSGLCSDYTWLDQNKCYAKA
jgi:hypothetical protein